MCICSESLIVRFIVSVVLMISVVALYCWYKPPDIRKCFKDQQQQQTDWRPLDDVLAAARKPRFGRSIFFVDTYCRQPMPTLFKKFYYGTTFDSGLADLDVFAACAIESAAIHNPHLDVYLLYASPVYMTNAMNTGTLVDAVLSYSNVQLRNVNIWTYINGTSLQEWFKSEAVFNSNYVMQNIASLLGFLTLWRYGGTYVGLNSIMTASIENLPPNYVGIDWNSSMTGNFINFAPTGFGHDIATQCLKEFEREFNGSRWDNGEHIMERVMESLNATNSFGFLTDKAAKCEDSFDSHASYLSVQPKWIYFLKTRPFVCVHRENHLKMASSKRGSHTNLTFFYENATRSLCPRVSKLFVEYLAALKLRTAHYTYEFD